MLKRSTMRIDDENMEFRIPSGSPIASSSPMPPQNTKDIAEDFLKNMRYLEATISAIRDGKLKVPAEVAALCSDVWKTTIGIAKQGGLTECR